MKTGHKILALMICAGAVLSFTACGKITTRVTESQATQASTQSQATTRPSATQPAETQGSIQLQISEHKTGYSIAGEPLPEQNQSKEFTLAKDGKVYEGLSDKAGDASRCILTITDISADAVTVVLLENSREVSKKIKYNTKYTYTAFINPDEYSYEYTITFVK
ncbi:MAG: hypothetical protein WCG21_03405 [Eubacteriales bacterium]